jgi:hypothetical protein
MLKDPLTKWEDGFPYDLLARVGITPGSTMREIREASFALMLQGGMTPEIRKAWDALRRPEQRLVADFFMIHGQYVGITLEGKTDGHGGGNDGSE